MIDSKIPKFPVDVFPKQIQDIIQASNKDLNYPVDFVSGAMLYAVSVAVGNTHHIEIKKGYSQTAVLYLALVGRAGTNKSHPLSFALSPITDKDSEAYKDYKKYKDEYDTIEGMSKRDRVKEAVTLPSEKPTWKKYLVSDFTPEALAQIHQNNQRGLGVYVDELKGWFNNFNRYNTGNEEEFWLSNWNNKGVTIDRKTSDPVFIPKPYISVVGTIQTKILKDLSKNNRSDNGFIERMLFIIPDNLKKDYLTENEINESCINNWYKIINKLTSLKLTSDTYGNIEPQIIRFTSEAKKIFFDYQKQLTDLSNDPKNENISGVFSKLEMQTARFSLLLEMMFYAVGESEKENISIEAIQGAIKLTEYFKCNLLKAVDIINNTNPLQLLTKDKQALYENLPETFTTMKGLIIAKKLDFTETTCKRFFNNKDLFEKIKHGEYEKKV